MLYMKCPSCFQTLGHVQLFVKEQMEKINVNKRWSERQKKRAIRRLFQVSVRDFCCRGPLLTYVDINTTVNP
jgi:DNA-directed RNA polymerase subunit N (RpoN/RPB10)